MGLGEDSGVLARRRRAGFLIPDDTEQRNGPDGVA
jgi:hypothetical protein